MTLFEWLAEVCKELRWPIMRSHDMLDDTRWSDMYEEGLAPGAAVDRACTEGWISRSDTAKQPHDF
jgi:hypothetical protein